MRYIAHVTDDSGAQTVMVVDADSVQKARAKVVRAWVSIDSDAKLTCRFWALPAEPLSGVVDLCTFFPDNNVFQLNTEFAGTMGNTLIRLREAMT